MCPFMISALPILEDIFEDPYHVILPIILSILMPLLPFIAIALHVFGESISLGGNKRQRIVSGIVAGFLTCIVTYYIFVVYYYPERLGMLVVVFMPIITVPLIIVVYALFQFILYSIDRLVSVTKRNN